MNEEHLCSGFGESQPSWPHFRVSAEMLIASNHDIEPGDRPLGLSSDELKAATATPRCQGDEQSAVRGRG